MNMGRSTPLPPEEADSWGEFHARLEIEAAGLGSGSPLTPLWWAIGGALFGTALICSAYATKDGWWLWLCTLASLGVVGVMAARAVDRADRERARAAQIARLQDAWLDHLEQTRR